MFSISTTNWTTSMTKLRCLHCANGFIPVPQVQNQAYCSNPDCQKQRRRQWQKRKLQSDPDYRDNQSRAQKAWSEKNPDYWRKHRQASQGSESFLENKPKQLPQESKVKSIKMDSSNQAQALQKALHDGVFRLKVLAEPDGVKMDTWIVELSKITKE
jgi:hypothetical protein